MQIAIAPTYNKRVVGIGKGFLRKAKGKAKAKSFSEKFILSKANINTFLYLISKLYYFYSF